MSEFPHEVEATLRDGHYERHACWCEPLIGFDTGTEGAYTITLHQNGHIAYPESGRPPA